MTLVNQTRQYMCIPWLTVFCSLPSFQTPLDPL
uniref:Uncharacterized protein n=1 Tax=Rhizophora mucronata TaxID=61149 RepID=A0A2P2R054_RHIMU